MFSRCLHVSRLLSLLSDGFGTGGIPTNGLSSLSIHTRSMWGEVGAPGAYFLGQFPLAPFGAMSNMILLQQGLVAQPYPVIGVVIPLLYLHNDKPDDRYGTGGCPPAEVSYISAFIVQ